MAGVLGQWRAGFTYLALMLLVLGAYTYMNSTKWAGHAEKVNIELDTRTAEDFNLAELEARAASLSPTSRIVSGKGPIHVMPASTTICANSASSDKKP